MAYLLDTNAFLNGLFNPFSSSRKVFESAIAGKPPASLCVNVVSESLSIVGRVAKATGVDLSHALLSFLALKSIKVLDDVDPALDTRLNAIQEKDRVIAATALANKLAVCTNGLEDYGPGRDFGLNLVTPGELANQGVIGLHTVFRLSLMNAERGAVYARFFPQWADVIFSEISTEKFYLFDQEGLGSLHYEACSSSFVFTGETIPSVRLKVGTVRKDQLPVRLVLSYDNSKCVLLVYGPEAVRAEAAGTWTGEGMTIGKGSLTHDRTGTNNLYGSVQLLSTFPSALTAKAARRLINGETVPDAQERISLEEIALRFYS